MKKVIPFGSRILVKRHKVGERVGSIYLPDETKDRDTDIADVVYIPDHSFADKELIDNAETIVAKMAGKAKDGDVDALKAMLEFNSFLKVKSIMVGDQVMVSKYVGTTFNDSQGRSDLTVLNTDDVIALIVEDK